MLFSSMIFLWIFLPAVLVLHRMVPQAWKNAVLLFASLLFYSWGEPKYIMLLLFSVTVNYFFGLLLSKQKRIQVLALCVAINLGLLGYFKYFDFLLSILNSAAGRQLFPAREIVLPLGISFYTFQALSYVIDVYRGEVKVQTDYGKLLLYVSFFPQLIAGPIVKYRDVEAQIHVRNVSAEKTVYGIRRFIYGLAKKVILSNNLAFYADVIMDGDIGRYSSGVLWLGAVLYALQIYFDFSGYSDMAIGLGKMFGFDFSENFRYPYISGSVREFWRRWHISLSTWFREYVYIPLGGNRKGRGRTYVNLLAVFFLTGLWHGASVNFIFWGLFHGCFLLLERAFLGRWLERNRIKMVNHVYTLLVVTVGWVFFRQDTMKKAFFYVGKMFSFSRGYIGVADMAGLKMCLLLLAAVLLCGFVQSLRPKPAAPERAGAVQTVVQFVLLFYCILLLASDAYNPFIYFRF